MSSDDEEILVAAEGEADKGLQKIRNGDPFREMYVKSEMDKSR